MDYDLLTIGNHELYVTEIAYGTFANFSAAYGEKYLTSNVEIIDRVTGEWRPVGNRYRYFKTKHGLRIMAFGVLFDFQGNSNVSRVTTAQDMVKQAWFTDAVKYPEPIDLFVLVGHNPVRTKSSSSTWATVHGAIRGMRPDVPIQIFGGHEHIRDFAVYDEFATGLASGQYCETLGWLAMTGIKSPTFRGKMRPRGVPNPTRRARKTDGSALETIDEVGRGRLKRGLRYARRYLDWNRLTFAYHATRSQDHALDTHHGVLVTQDITDARKDLNLTYVFGCAPQTYCRSCKPFDTNGSIYPLLRDALAKVVVNPDRADTPRLIITNTGSIRFDLVQGPFTVDDAFIVSPFKNTFQYIPDVPYSQASQVLDILNSGPWQKRDIEAVPAVVPRDVCTNPPFTYMQAKRDILAPRSVTRRGFDSTELTSGYTTTDDFGSDGDDTPHSEIPSFEYPNDIQANVSFPTDGSTPETVDLVFVSYLGANWVIPALESVGARYTVDDIQLYMPENFLSNQVLPLYAAAEWQKNMPNCPVGGGIE